MCDFDLCFLGGGWNTWFHLIVEIIVELYVVMVVEMIGRTIVEINIIETIVMIVVLIIKMMFSTNDHNAISPIEVFVSQLCVSF